MAILQRPLDQRPELLGFPLIAPGQRITGRSVGDHRSITTVTGTVPDVDTLRNDRTWYRLILRIHEASKVQIGVQSRLITDTISQIREERIDVLCLVVCPQCSVIRLSTRSVHETALRQIDAFRSPNLRESKQRVDSSVRRIQHQLSQQLVHQCLTRCQFLFYIRCYLWLLRLVADEEDAKGQLFSFLQTTTCTALQSSDQLITAVHALVRIGLKYGSGGRNFYFDGFFR